MSLRMDKINHQMQREISMILSRDLADPRLQFVSITRVDVSPDLHNAKVFFSVLGEDERVEQARVSLDHARGMIRKIVSQRLQLRRTPELTFEYDNSLASAARVEEIIREMSDESESTEQGS